MVSDELWVVMPGETEDDVGNVCVFEGDFDTYRSMLRYIFELKNRDEMAAKALLSGGRLRAQAGT